MWARADQYIRIVAINAMSLMVKLVGYEINTVARLVRYVVSTITRSLGKLVIRVAVSIGDNK